MANSAEPANLLLSNLFLFLLLLNPTCLTKPSTTKDDVTVPLVIWPGMGDSCCYNYGAASYKELLERLIPGIYIKMVAFGKTPQEDSYNSFFLNANIQIEKACDLLSSDSKLRNGFNAIGFSQGSQFLRALVQRCGTIKMYNLISVGGQHQGVYGFPFCLGENNILCHLFRRILSVVTYLSFIQDYLVQVQYWHDPYDEEEYQLGCDFLPDINQEIIFNLLYKERLSNLSNLVLIKFLNDAMVQPKETEWFGFYRPGQSMEVYSLFESKLYKQDLLGLQYLHSNGRLHFLSSSGSHLQFTYQWFYENIIPYINTTYNSVQITV